MRATRLVRLAATLALAAVPTQAPRAQPVPAPRFEAASVKPNPSRTGVRGHSFPGDRFEARNVPLADLILVAFGDPGQLLPPARLSGGPEWIERDRFDVSATAGSDGPSTVAGKQAMLRSLLTDRFKLTVHTETRVLPAYALVSTRGRPAPGLRLRRADAECEPMLASQPGARDRCLLSAGPSGELVMRGQSIGGLANALSLLLGRSVIDRTGLTGAFDADARFSPEGLPGMSARPPGGTASDDAPPLATALEEQLGLGLESIQAPVDILVVDAVEHPTDN